MNYDIVALVMGGGDRQSMETFNDLSLSELFIIMKPVTITAIGHTVDETLLDKLADKRFHLPHNQVVPGSSPGGTTLWRSSTYSNVGAFYFGSSTTLVQQYC